MSDESDHTHQTSPAVEQEAGNQSNGDTTDQSNNAQQPITQTYGDTGAKSHGDLFERFTERARKVLSLAQDEAQRFNHNYIGTEHLLLGLAREGDGVAAEVLANLGAELNKVRSAVEFIIGRGDRVVLGEIGLTPRAKKVIELAVDEARRLNHHYLGTEHILLGLVREGEGIAAGVLESLGISLEKVRVVTIQVLAQSGSQDDGREKHSKTPTIDQMGIDLTAHARMGKLDPAFGYEQEIEGVIQIISRLQRNNPVLVGESGVSKTAIVEGLAQRIVSGEVPETMMGKRLLTLDVTLLLAGMKERGEFEERLKKIIEEIRSSQDCIIFIDEVHTLVGAGAAEGAVDAANILKPALSRSELQCIGATTLDEYRKYIEKDAALQRRFQEVMVREPSIEDTINILKGLRDRYELHHRLTISDEALRAAAEMGSRYITDRFLPDKAIDLIDDAASRVRMQRSLAPLNLKEAMRGLEAVLREKNEAIQNQQYEQAQALLERERKLRERITKVETDWTNHRWDEKPSVGPEDIAQIVFLWTGIPVVRIMQGEALPGGEIESTPQEGVPSDRVGKTKLFISYSHEDKGLCQILANELAKADFNAWYDYHLTPGEAWIREIEREIGERRVFVLLVSPEAMSSDWVQREIYLATRLNKEIIPVMIRPTSLDRSFLGNLQRVNAINRDGQEIARLLLPRLKSL